MSTHAPTIDGFPAHLRDIVEAFTAGFLATVTDREEITSAAVGGALERESQRMTRLAFDRRRPGRDALTGALSGTYDEFRAAAGLTEGKMLHERGR